MLSYDDYLVIYLDAKFLAVLYLAWLSIFIPVTNPRDLSRFSPKRKSENRIHGQLS
jgi:hypothetical protein